jgi:hypothetical protein
MARNPPPPVRGTSALVLFIDRDDGQGRKAYYLRKLWPGEMTAWRLTRTDGSSCDVLLVDGEPSCSCQDAVFRERVCKHGKALKAHGLI